MKTTLRLFGALLITAIVVGAALAINALRNKDIEDWRRNLRGMTFILSEHTGQTVFAAQQVLNTLSERIQQAHIQDEADFRAKLSTPEVYQLLHDKIQGMPQLDVATLVAANGDNINFSRSYPVSGINLAERDYFKAHRNNPELGDYISTSVRNKGNGKWTFYVTRRVNNAQGQFMGLILVGLSVEAITGIYDRVVESFGEGAGITLFRSDRTALARSPRQDEVIGRISQSGPAHNVLTGKASGENVILSNAPRFTTGEPELRLTAVQQVERYPLAVAVIVPESIFLADWRRTAWMIGGLGLISIAFVVAGIGGLTRSMTRREQTEENLRLSETKFHTMLDWAIDWEYWIREDQSIHYMTPSAKAFTGYSVTDFVRDPHLLETVIHPEDLERWQQHTQQAHHHRHHPRDHHRDHPMGEALDLRIVHRDGSLRWVSHLDRPVYGTQGDYLGRRVTMRDITERKASETEIRQLAYYDPLTHLPNRRLFMDRLRHALIASARNQSYGALMLLDLDHFKKLNDTQGHDVGDRLLIEVGRRLALSVREADTVSRLGGDEFAVMIDGLDADETVAARQTEQVAEKIHATLHQPYNLSVRSDIQPDHRSSASIGVALFSGENVSIETLIKQADVALYQAKDAGRSAIRFFNPAMQAAINTRIAMELALRQALKDGEFRIHYQPQVDAQGHVIGAEALIRWDHPVQGLLLPDTFIPLAEETGLIVDIGQWVLDNVCAQLKLWQDDPAHRCARIAVNVSARQFHQPDFVDRVRRSLASSGANPQGLKLELTETIVVERIDEVVQRMEQLHLLGVTFSLDDFGIGYSSLSYLKRLPLDEIKIDQTFVRDVMDDSNDAAIVQAILAMSTSLGLRVIAEGVENTAQRDFLKEHGCQGYQGHLYSRPVPIADWSDADFA
ncbi:EAL domain-containing protein [Leptothrix ochracea]|uniref:bifunctional diguanylate cyclase/phosphodiesterase n=1 Tax=Leptothrix ochracea TaxID=735331 RepID=UPI0034E2AF1B